MSMSIILERGWEYLLDLAHMFLIWIIKYLHSKSAPRFHLLSER